MQFVVVVKAIDKQPTLFEAELNKLPLVNTAVTLGDDGDILVIVEAATPLGAVEIVLSPGFAANLIATVEVPPDSGFFRPAITDVLGRIHLVPDIEPTRSDLTEVPNKPSGKKRDNSSINHPSHKMRRGFDPLATDY